MKIEEGKRYVRRDGEISGPMQITDNEKYPFMDGTSTYTANGRIWKPIITDLDLIEEYKENAMKEVDFSKPLRFVDNTDELKYIGIDSRGYYIVEIVPVNVLLHVNRYGHCEGWQEIENVPEKLVRWVNIYHDGNGGAVHETREAADRRASHDRIACLRVEFTEGEGL